MFSAIPCKPDPGQLGHCNQGFAAARKLQLPSLSAGNQVLRVRFHGAVTSAVVAPFQAAAAALLLLAAILPSSVMSAAQPQDGGSAKSEASGIIAGAPHAQQIKVLTLNCWGLWLVAKQRQKRFW